MADSSLILTLGAGCILVASLLARGTVRSRRTLARANKAKASS